MEYPPNQPPGHAEDVLRVILQREEENCVELITPGRELKSSRVGSK